MGRYFRTTLLLLFAGTIISLHPQETQAKINIGFCENDFRKIAAGGFGDFANSYAWSMAYFNGDLYVGVNRYHGAALMTTFFPGGMPGVELPGPPKEDWGQESWAEDMSGAIWRYHAGEWSIVHRSEVAYGTLPILPTPVQPAPEVPIVGYYPLSYGYRTMGVFDNHIYAIGIGTWVPNMPLARILRSPNGDPDTWEDVSGIIATATNPRGLVEYKGKLFISASLPGSAVTGAGMGVVYCSSDPKREGWKQVSGPGFGNADNVEIPYLAVFNDCLYASTINYNSGFEVWKTDGSPAEDGLFRWKPVITGGCGDTYNQWGMTMKAFGKYLYIGTAVGGGIVFKDDQIAGTRAIDVIRVDRYDRPQMVVGAYMARDPSPGWPKFRRPLSVLPAGFGNPLNVYTWHMEVHKGWLYLGTFDMSGMLFQGLEGLFGEEGATDSASANALSTIEGADLWKTRDGVHWFPVTLNGFNNPNTFGIRRLLSVPGKGLFVGTTNGMEGCEVLQAED